MLNPNSITITKEQNDNVTVLITGEKSFNLLSESYLTKMLNSVLVRGKDGSTLYEFFYTEVNEVIRKDATVVSITDNDILFDELNQFFFFINNAAVSPGGLTNLPVGNFVFVNPLGNDGTGIREDYAFPFLTLNAAKNAALSGDTIFVYGGTYNEANQLHKTGVKWHFIGQPLLNLSAPDVWDDSGLIGQQFINISGDAIVNHISLGSVINVTQINTVVNINFKSVTSLGYSTLLLQNGSGVINVSESINCTLTNRTVYLDGNASYKINADEILNNAASGIASCVYVKNNANIYTGLTVINTRLIKCDSLFSAVRLDYGANTGTVVINVLDKIIWTNLLGGTYPQTDNAVINMGGDLIINGNIDGGNGHAIQVSTATYDKSITHNGNAYNNGNLPLIGFGDFDIAFWLSNKATIKLNGDYTSGNEKVITHKGTTSKIDINGNIINNYTGATNCYGLFLESDADVTLLNNVKIVSDLSATNPFGIGAAAARDIKIVHNVSSNVDTDANITNLITGTTYVYDTDIE